MSTGLTPTGDSNYDLFATIKLAIAPSDNNTLYATLPHQTIQGVFKEYFTDIEFNPNNTSEIFASTSKSFPVCDNSGSIWHSTDEGVSWTEITGDLLMKRINSLAYDNGYLYIATEGANVIRKEIKTTD